MPAQIIFGRAQVIFRRAQVVVMPVQVGDQPARIIYIRALAFCLRASLAFQLRLGGFPFRIPACLTQPLAYVHDRFLS